MGTNIRPEITKRSKYYISKHRYYELRHYVQQYPDWVRSVHEIDGYSRRPVGHAIFSSDLSDPTSDAAIKRDQYQKHIDLVTRIANETDKTIGIDILNAIINNRSYDCLRTLYEIPVCRDVYYDLYRKFFFLLDKARK